MRFTIRKARKDELPEIFAIEVDSFPAAGTYTYLALRQLFDISPDYCFLAETDELLGYTLGAITSSGVEGWVLNLAVLPIARRKGVGEALTGSLRQALIDGGAESLYLTVNPQNTSAIKLYDQLGFVELGVHPDYFGPGVDRLIMKYAV